MAVLLDLSRLSARVLLLMAIFVPLERFFPVHPKKVFRKAFLPDLVWYFLSGILPGLVLAVPMAAIAWLLRHLIPAGLPAHVAAQPLWIRYVAATIVGEIGFYWGHRWSHEIPFLWRFHAIHHSAEEMDWLVNTRAHPVDLVFTRLCGFVPLFALGLAQPMARAPDIVPLLVVLTATLWGFFIHANVKWRLESLTWLVSTPAFHHWHHTYEGPLNRNFASMLPCVDKLFGTWHLPKNQWPSRYGTESYVAPDLTGQLLEPLMPLRAGSGERSALVRAGNYPGKQDDQQSY